MSQCYFAFPQGDTAEELAESARRGVEAGHSVFYLKVGRGEEPDMETAAAVREVVFNMGQTPGRR